MIRDVKSRDPDHLLLHRAKFGLFRTQPYFFYFAGFYIERYKFVQILLFGKAAK
jgi:hypothetical protein